MSVQNLRCIKKLKILKDGSAIYIYHNGCRNNYALLIKDIVKHPVWLPQSKLKLDKKSHPSLEKYRKKFAKNK